MARAPRKPPPLPSVSVQRDVLRDQVCQTLFAYKQSGTLVYNAGSGEK